MTRLPRLVTAVVGTAVLLAVLLLGVFPTRSYFQQREAIEREQQKLAVLDRENARLAARVAELQSDEEIERLAREQYSLVKPGEEAYAILPGPDEEPPGHRVPPPEVEEPSFLERAVDSVTFWN